MRELKLDGNLSRRELEEYYYISNNFKAFSKKPQKKAHSILNFYKGWLTFDIVLAVGSELLFWTSKDSMFNTNVLIGFTLFILHYVIFNIFFH